MASAVLCALAAVAAASAAATPERPNILFIYTDDHSHRTVGAYPEAYPWVRTPAMDRLASQGVRFEYAYIGTWCMPSRATLLTGFHQFGVESMRMEGPYPGSTYDPEVLPFWPKVFRENGYFTAQIGKWHTGTDTGYGRDWDFQIVWNRPKYTTTNQNYYYDQPITYQGGETKVLERYSSDRGCIPGAPGPTRLGPEGRFLGGRAGWHADVRRPDPDFLDTAIPPGRPCPGRGYRSRPNGS